MEEAEPRASDRDPGLHLSEPSFGYWAPELRELHVRLPIQAVPVGGEEPFKPLQVLLDGTKPRYAFWYVDGTAYAYWWVKQASQRRLELFVPLPWRPGQRHQLRVAYNYCGRDQEQTVAIRTPLSGGAWQESDGGNYGFLVREEAGLARRNEPVEFDLTVEADLFAQPEQAVRATIMTAPGAFQEIPCQVYNVQHCAAKGTYTSIPLVRFRAAVQLSLQPYQEALVILWHCPRRPARREQESPVRLRGGALGGRIENEHYMIEIEPRSGQLMQWHDKRTGVCFGYQRDPAEARSRSTMNYTPDVYRIGANWAHADDWVRPQSQVLHGPVFCETARWAPMRDVPEVTARVTYRFYAGRPEVRLSSVTRILKDIDVLGFRNGGMIQSPQLYTHVAWPRQDGRIVRLPIQNCYGNDTGAPPPARAPLSTPWVAFYHSERHYGLALVSLNASYFHEGPRQPNLSNAQRYVSLWNGRFLYTVRAMNFTYCSGIRSYHTPMDAGTVAYEEVALLPFTFQCEDQAQFEAVEALRRQMLKPLVVVP